MKSFVVLELEVFAQALDGLGDAIIVLQVDFLIFDTAPEPFNEDVVRCSTASVHTDGDLSLFENADKSTTGELNTLIRIEDFWSRLFQGLIQVAGTEIRF